MSLDAMIARTRLEYDPSVANELEALRELVRDARDHIGSMPTVGVGGSEEFFKTLRIVTKLEAKL